MRRDVGREVWKGKRREMNVRGIREKREEGRVRGKEGRVRREEG